MIQIVHECKSVVHVLLECPVHVYDSIGGIWLVKSETLLCRGRWVGGGGEFEESFCLLISIAFVSDWRSYKPRLCLWVRGQ